jgi:GR25 family glycosyltransferase involved in LPS biosynthesis
MKNIDKIYLINMKRSTDRLDHFMAEMRKHNLPFEKLHVFCAIDATIHDLTPDELELTKHMREKGEIKTVICNFLSHYYVWKDIITHSYKNALVLQDDVYFVDGISEKIDKVVEYTPADAVTVNIGLHKYSRLWEFVEWNLNESYDPLLYAEKFINEYICVYKNNINPCSLAYIVKGAEIATHNFFSRFHDISDAIDGFFNHFHKNNNIFYGSRYVLATGNSNFKSTVFIDPLSIMSFSEYLLSYQQNINKEEDD